MARFLLPLREGRTEPGPFSPAALFVSAVVAAVVVNLVTEPMVVLSLFFLVLIGGTVARTRWRAVLGLAARFEFVVLFWVLLEPITYGQTVVGVIQTPWGPLPVYREGIRMGILLGLRMVTILTTVLAALSHMTLSDLIGALQTIRLPGIILGSLVIMMRYLPVFMEERRRMEDALALRGLQTGSRRERLRALGSMVGTTIDRAFTRSEAVYDAMKLRGFSGCVPVTAAGLRRTDVLLLMLLGLFALAAFYVFPAVVVL